MSERSPITTHILDLGTGNPAAGVAVSLTRVADTGEQHIAKGQTDADGRLSQWFQGPLQPGTYRIQFATGDWYQAQGKTAFHPRVTIDFAVVDTERHYHVPLLVNQYGYSTYRGS
ncbi:hydroxyisourate hydrolase [Natronospirillum operosum]|uniref:5-hydroxyisourate hydrolase n=1 Tax=Natronospirillum operosum TaxID=2759953 RepID=A0A4Z0W9R6_9GAMM|nr:hydroxyisourate hydrolase [Natronospirillum operosum]TGG92073.1 hydroxyisourate hydrolase [Natronospirillum operosum]